MMTAAELGFGWWVSLITSLFGCMLMMIGCWLLAGSDADGRKTLIAAITFMLGAACTASALVLLFTVFW